jgi:hypothetical protein
VPKYEERRKQVEKLKSGKTGKRENGKERKKERRTKEKVQ